jgi:hypothetical protein
MPCALDADRELSALHLSLLRLECAHCSNIEACAVPLKLGYIDIPARRRNRVAGAETWICVVESTSLALTYTALYKVSEIQR